MATSEDLRDQLRELRTSLEALPEVSEPPKPMLRILGSMRAEQKWNTLLAYFLDPSQPHGFGVDLLNAFLDKATQETNLELEYYHRDFETVSVETEVSSPQNNRLDILIRVPGEWFVCIESKVDASEGERQTLRYVEDPQIGNEEKSSYPEDERHYLFLSKKFSTDSTADGFEDIYWRHVVEAFQEKLNLSQGRYPQRSVSQLDDFLSTIIKVTNMTEDDFEQIQQEKIQLFAKYKEDIDELIEASNQLRQRTIEEWPERFRSHVGNELWSDTWNTRPGKWGIIYRDGWYLDGDLNPTADVEETRGNNGIRLHFMHYIREEEAFLDGELKFELVCNTSVPVREGFYQLFNSPKWRAELESRLDESTITGNKSTYTQKVYDVDQADLPESYFETLALAFEEHLPIVEVIDEILQEAVDNVK